MCDVHDDQQTGVGQRKIPIHDAVGMVLAHDITEIRKDEFKGRAFRKGHVVTKDDVCHLQRLGKEHLFVLTVSDDELHEDTAAYALAKALMGQGVAMQGEPKEGKINIVACREGLLKINREALLEFNMLGDVMCATLHDNTIVRKGQAVAGTRAVPLVVKRRVVERACSICEDAGKVVQVREIRRPRAGVVITGNEVYRGRIKDAFAPIIKKKVYEYNGEIVGIYYAPDDEQMIAQRLSELIEAGADLLITTGGMSVDPDDVTRFAIRDLGAREITYGSAALPGAMFLIAYIEDESSRRRPQFTTASRTIPILGVPACGMYHKTTIFDLILPRVLAGERIGRRELAELGHGGFCLDCKECRYPLCPFGKS